MKSKFLVIKWLMCTQAAKLANMGPGRGGGGLGGTGALAYYAGVFLLFISYPYPLCLLCTRLEKLSNLPKIRLEINRSFSRDVITF